MAFRTEAKTLASLILCASLGWGATEYSVHHEHLRHDGAGVLRIDDTSIAFEEPGKQAKHSRIWRYDDIQELTLGPDSLRIVTYEDQRWELGRDRVYVFEQLPASLAPEWYPVFRAKLDQRFVAALADETLTPEWQIPAKLTHGRSGSHGSVLVGQDGVVYASAERGESRTWRIGDIENVSSSGPFDLTLTTHEREFRFQLKQSLNEGKYQELWMRVNRARGLEILNADKGR